MITFALNFWSLGFGPVYTSNIICFRIDYLMIYNQLTALGRKYRKALLDDDDVGDDKLTVSLLF